MIQQLKFSPVENVLAVLFVVVILGYLLYLLDRSLQNKQRGKHIVSRATFVSKEQEVSNRIYRELQEGDSGRLCYRGGKLISFGALQNRDDRERSFRR